MLHHMVNEKAAMEQQLGNISQELQNQAAVKESLQTKVQQLYDTLKSEVSNKEGLDRLFNQVMGGEEGSEEI